MTASLLLAGLFCAAAVAQDVVGVANPFECAKPVWVAGVSKGKNEMYGFRGDFVAQAGDRAVLRITGCSVYRVWINGSFAGYGPARAAKGFFRVDEFDVSALVQNGKNAVAIEISSYGVPGFYRQKQPPFLQAEVVVDGKVVTATPLGFDRIVRIPRIRRCTRFSYQRGFNEVYDIGLDSFAWRTNQVMNSAFKLEECPSVRYLPRRVGCPKFEMMPFVFAGGTEIRFADERAKSPFWQSEWIERWPHFGFSPSELEFDVFATNVCIETVSVRRGRPSVGMVGGGQGVLLDAGSDVTGFLSLTVVVSKPGLMGVLFDEMLVDGKVLPAKIGNGRKLSVVNGFYYRFREPGVYRIETFEPYTMRWAHVCALEGGEMEIRSPQVRCYRSAAADGFRFERGSAGLRRIFEAGRETFAQNAVDVMTDCPSRERAGWLADSFFTARASRMLTGSNAIEDLFIENFVVADRFDDIPDGMLPMCYPADFIDGKFIPNWAMWFVLQVDDYARRRDGDHCLVDRLRPRFEKLIDFLWKYRNEDGLLEKLPSWVFVEWSKANDLTQDVNYPSNMLWAETLDCMNRLYGRADLADEARRVRCAVRRQSWNGEWFCDNAVRREDGSLVGTGERTEVCQYYAFFCGLATPESHTVLWRRLVNDFGPVCKQTGRWKEIWPADAFFGYYLRLELLARAGLRQQVCSEIEGYFGGMVDATGTLWEYNRPHKSCCHGFASYITVLLEQCAQ